MKKVVKEIGWGMCKDEDGNIYVGVEDEICQNEETGEIYRITKKDEKGYVVELESGFDMKLTEMEEQTAEMVTALANFRDAYEKLLDTWDLYDLNDTEAIGNYPFEESFDELPITDWCNETINEISK